MYLLCPAGPIVSGRVQKVHPATHPASPLDLDTRDFQLSRRGGLLLPQFAASSTQGSTAGRPDRIGWIEPIRVPLLTSQADLALRKSGIKNN